MILGNSVGPLWHVEKGKAHLAEPETPGAEASKYVLDRSRRKLVSDGSFLTPACG